MHSEFIENPSIFTSWNWTRYFLFAPYVSPTIAFALCYSR